MDVRLDRAVMLLVFAVLEVFVVFVVFVVRAALRPDLAGSAYWGTRNCHPPNPTTARLTACQALKGHVIQDIRKIQQMHCIRDWSLDFFGLSLDFLHVTSLLVQCPPRSRSSKGYGRLTISGTPV